ncbi:hypothetical protein IV203_016031 [Nitzschia inconspicua]|uniref:Uncharacterized protein n=1 Tax=Nitzschia inconspicua TaxID=303405 RepID=A0A9K3KPX1_9STRA|nr:hypothetical protein IV203_016031 [Nitzschia inconspicua]
MLFRKAAPRQTTDGMSTTNKDDRSNMDRNDDHDHYGKSRYVDGRLALNGHADGNEAISSFYRRASEQHYYDSTKEHLSEMKRQGIQNHVECYSQNYYQRSAKSPRPVSEEYDIESNISGLTRDSDFTIDKENCRPNGNSQKSNKDTRTKKNRKKKKVAADTSMNRNSFAIANLSIFGNGRGWRIKNSRKQNDHLAAKNKMTTATREKQMATRARSLSPDRSHADTLLSLPAHDMAKSSAGNYVSNRNSQSELAKRMHYRSKSFDLVNHQREPSPTRLAHPHIQYQIDQLMGPNRSSKRNLVSPEPLGTKLEDFFFRTPRGDASPVEKDRVEPLGVRLDLRTQGVVTPMTADVYVVEDLPRMTKGPPFLSMAPSNEKIHEIYQDIERDQNITFEGVDAEAARLEAELPPLRLGKGRTGNFLAESDSVKCNDVLGGLMPWVQDDPYTGRAKERIRSRLQRPQCLIENVRWNNDKPELINVPEPPLAAIDGNSDTVSVSSLDADKSDSFDWKAFANYLDSKEDKAALHRSKYRSLLLSPKKGSAALVTTVDSHEVQPRKPIGSLKRSQSTGELGLVPLKNTAKQSHPKEYLEFSTRESGGFLQATCFQENKPSTRLSRRKKSLDQQSVLDWIDKLGDDTATIPHNDSHELNFRSKKVKSVKNGSKSAIRAITKEASSKLLLVQNENIEEASVPDYDFAAGLYQMIPGNSRHHIRHSQTKDVVRHLPFPETPSPPKEEIPIASSDNSTRSIGSRKQSHCKKVPATLSTSERKRIISDFLSARDGSSARDKSRTPSDRPEEFKTPATRASFRARTKVYEDFQSEYSVPTLGISPRSVMSMIHDQDVKAFRVCNLRNSGRMDASSVVSSKPTNSSVINRSGRSQVSTQGIAIFPPTNPPQLHRLCI